MDKRKFILFKYLLSHCNDGYKVLETAVVLKANKKYKGNYAEFLADIETLKSLKYIDLKYIDETNLCLKILDNSLILEENIRNERKMHHEHLMFILISMALSGVMAFIGGFLASIIFR